MGVLQLKRGALVDKPTLEEGEVYLDETNGNMIVNIDGTEKTFKPDSGVKVYRALVSQSGTDAPVATVLENTLGGNPVWSRTNTGTYSLILQGCFPLSRTFIQNLRPVWDKEEVIEGGTATLYIAGEDEIVLNSYDSSNVSSDLDTLGFSYVPIEIIVYPE